MDTTSKNVSYMYKKFPYPFPSSKTKSVNELLNLFKIFSLENKFNFDNKNVLDAGTGTGHRIINVALNYKKTCFLGLDFSKNSIKIAQELAKKNQATNIKFCVTNLLKKIDSKMCSGQPTSPDPVSFRGGMHPIPCLAHNHDILPNTAVL